MNNFIRCTSFKKITRIFFIIYNSITSYKAYVSICTVIVTILTQYTYLQQHIAIIKIKPLTVIFSFFMKLLNVS